MTYDPERHHRASIRLQGYDYATPNWYYVTVCVQHRLPLFGQVTNGIMVCSPAGEMVTSIWQQIPQRFPGVDIDFMVVMPDHMHGIVSIMEVDATITSLSSVMHWFKTITTNTYGRRVKTSGWRAFHGRLWQQTFYDHIIRNDHDLDRIRTYIADNPERWSMKHGPTLM